MASGRNCAKVRTENGYPACDRGVVLSFFMAGPDMVRCELTVESDGPFCLTVRHAQGVIVEYFHTSAAALLRQQELQDLLMAARGAVSAK
jgi:hypothetical protein